MQTTVLQWVGPDRTSDGKESVAHCYHRSAMRRSYRHPVGSALRAMLEGWERYALAHRDQFESAIGDDGVLGSEWAAIGQALRGLLNGDLGGWDGGSLDANILRIMDEHGVDTANL